MFSDLKTELRILVFVFLFSSITTVTVAETGGQIAQWRASHLRHGVNASEWFAQVYDPKGYTKEHFDAWMGPADFVSIKSMGFDHVRLSVNPEPMFNARQPNMISPEYLGYLDHAVKM